MSFQMKWKIFQKEQNHIDCIMDIGNVLLDRGVGELAVEEI